jgi:hypothetical protein
MVATDHTATPAIGRCVAVAAPAVRAQEFIGAPDQKKEAAKRLGRVDGFDQDEGAGKRE